MSKINARKKGNQFETDLAVELREFFPDVATSRSESKRTDDLLCDFCYTGDFVIQAKAWQRAPSYHDILKELGNNFKDKSPVIMHKKNHRGTVVVMPKELFYTLLKVYLEWK